ncbi:RETICULON-LIKE PROTEIN B17 [Salix koriyanagi]|uniref:Reticulon-like protein n=1 Tax=Salix koriyanagi TaxID=2511006 RepID=A0A9Q0W526_9ROSI|nr:RETICULON-LIKE PROTEIN B17 [Salix koriyanagi]
MDVSRRGVGVKTSVVAGSVWENRMKLDEVKGGIKVFNGEENVGESGGSNGDAGKKMVKRGHTGTGAGVAMSGKRRTWKSESFDGPIQIAKGKNSEHLCKELSVSVDGIKKNPGQARKGRSEGSNKELSLSVDGIDKSSIQAKKGSKEIDGIVRSPIPVKKGRSEPNKEVGVSADGNEKSPSQIRKQRSDIKEVVESGVELRKVKSDSVKVLELSEIGKDPVLGGVERNSVQLRMAKSEADKVLDESVNGIEKIPPEIEENGSEETCKESGVCQEKVISISETNESIEKPPPKLLFDNPPPPHDDDDDVVIDGDEDIEGDEDEEEIEIQIEKKSLDIKEINISEEKIKKVETNVADQKPAKVETNVADQKPAKVETNVADQKPAKVETNAAEPKPKKVETNVAEKKSTKVEICIPEQKPKRVVSEVKKVQQFNNRTAPTSSIVNKQPPPVIKRATLYQNLAKAAANPSIPVANGHQKFKETHRHSKLQNLVDLVMWRDISRSTLAFGMGTFIIISSSYSKDLNVSFISVMSYLGLVYLATIFLYRSLIRRGVIGIDDDDDGSYVLGEGEAIWLLRLVLPYLNECLLKIRALFSGDPATTMKMAVLLFVFARCGSSITVWKMAKLGFFGVFTVPKVCSSYSPQLTAYGKFWIRRFRDAWESCSHKKAVALGIFTLVWNLSSMVARIWAVFMMFVAVRYYQQTMERDDWVVEEEEEEEVDTEADGTWHEDIGGQRQGSGPTLVEVNKAKKGA